MKERGQTDDVFMDLSKVFDRVPHNKLIEKLHHVGLNENITLCINSYLSKKTRRICCNHTCSLPLAVHSGVPQGSVHGQLLFIIYVKYSKY